MSRLRPPGIRGERQLNVISVADLAPSLPDSRPARSTMHIVLFGRLAREERGRTATLRCRWRRHRLSSLSKS